MPGFFFLNVALTFWLQKCRTGINVFFWLCLAENIIFSDILAIKLILLKVAQTSKRKNVGGKKIATSKLLERKINITETQFVELFQSVFQSVRAKLLTCSLFD